MLCLFSTQYNMKTRTKVNDWSVSKGSNKAKGCEAINPYSQNLSGCL